MSLLYKYVYSLFYAIVNYLNCYPECIGTLNYNLLHYYFFPDDACLSETSWWIMIMSYMDMLLCVLINERYNCFRFMIY